MADDSKCLKCGAPLNADARDGVCSKCHSGRALPAAGTGGSATPSSTAPCQRCQTPTLAAELVDGLCPQCVVLVMHELNEAARRPPPAAKTQPVTFGDYELLGEIAHGGMEVVFKARQVSLNRVVAVKMIRAGNLARADDVKRFQTEAQAAAQLQHPNIVAIHEVGEQDSQPFFSMDYVAGKSLSQLAREKPLGPKPAARYVQKIAEAIHYAHQRGILHRDLKPSNVLIDQNDEPRVTDFGLAKLMTGTRN